MSLPLQRHFMSEAGESARARASAVRRAGVGSEWRYARMQYKAAIFTVMPGVKAPPYVKARQLSTYYLRFLRWIAALGKMRCRHRKHKVRRFMGWQP